MSGFGSSSEANVREKMINYPRKQASSTEYPSIWDQCQCNLRPFQYAYINQSFPLECLVTPWSMDSPILQGFLIISVSVILQF